MEARVSVRRVGEPDCFGWSWACEVACGACQYRRRCVCEAARYRKLDPEPVGVVLGRVLASVRL